jgi:hypothetical protein
LQQQQEQYPKSWTPHINFLSVLFSSLASEEELAFCNRMACFLTKSTDLPLVCRNKFPSVVEAVDHKSTEAEDAMLHFPVHHQSSLHLSVNAAAVASGYNDNYSNVNTMYPMPPPSDR